VGLEFGGIGLFGGAAAKKVEATAAADKPAASSGVFSFGGGAAKKDDATAAVDKPAASSGGSIDWTFGGFAAKADAAPPF
jgi:hypothetical protein